MVQGFHCLYADFVWQIILPLAKDLKGGWNHPILACCALYLVRNKSDRHSYCLCLLVGAHTSQNHSCCWVAFLLCSVWLGTVSAVWMWGANHKALRNPVLCCWYKGTCPYSVLVLCRRGHSIQMLFVQVLDLCSCSGKCRWIITHALLQKILFNGYLNRKHAICRKDVIIRIMFGLLITLKVILTFKIIGKLFWVEEGKISALVYLCLRFCS